MKTKNVLITGAAGFVGSRVVAWFNDNTDHSIICLIRLKTAGDLNRLEDFQSSARISFVYHDLKYPINRSVSERIPQLDYVIHLAANSHVDRSIASPMEFFEDNVIGTINLLEFINRYHPLARLINFSTDEVYGPAPDGVSFKENDRFRPSNPYSASKASQNMIGIAYANTYGLDIINTYTMNIFGEGQNQEKLIPKAIRHAMERKPMPVFAELKGKELISVGSRHWLYVENVPDAICFLLNSANTNSHYNIVGTDELTNEYVVKEVNRLLGTEPLIEYVDVHKQRPGHDRRYSIDGTKLKTLGWTPKISFNEGLRKTINNS